MIVNLKRKIEKVNKKTKVFLILDRVTSKFI